MTLRSIGGGPLEQRIDVLPTETSTSLMVTFSLDMLIEGFKITRFL